MSTCYLPYPIITRVNTIWIFYSEQLVFHRSNFDLQSGGKRVRPKTAKIRVRDSLLLFTWFSRMSTPCHARFRVTRQLAYTNVPYLCSGRFSLYVQITPIAKNRVIVFVVKISRYFDFFLNSNRLVRLRSIPL